MPDPLASLGVQKDLRAIVTAGAGGIGRAIADAVIANGARVLVSDVEFVPELGIPEHQGLEVAPCGTAQGRDGMAECPTG